MTFTSATQHGTDERPDPIDLAVAHAVSANMNSHCQVVAGIAKTLARMINVPLDGTVLQAAALIVQSHLPTPRPQHNSAQGSRHDF
jgi:NaMN:DMB phosphoribosyltransferase